MRYCVGFIFNKNLDQVLLVKKNPCNLADKELASYMKGKLNAIGGKIEENEKPIDGMVRECKEETGLILENWQWCRFCTIDTKGGLIYFYYSITNNIYDFQQIEDHEELGLYSLYYDAEDRLDRHYQSHIRMPNLDWLIPMALNHYNGLDKARFEIKEIYG